jgi:hypothetical protein
MAKTSLTHLDIPFGLVNTSHHPSQLLRRADAPIEDLFQGLLGAQRGHCQGPLIRGEMFLCFGLGTAVDVSDDLVLGNKRATRCVVVTR